MPAERLQKILARAGVASRRAAEDLIVNGRVKVDGRVVTELGTRVDARRSRIDLDNKRLVAEPFVYVILHKPRGVMCTLSDPEGRDTVADLLKGVGVRVVPVGRLDYHTSGALLCTNDGDFAGKLLHPRGGVPKEYVAKVRGLIGEESLARWGESRGSSLSAPRRRQELDFDRAPRRPQSAGAPLGRGDRLSRSAARARRSRRDNYRRVAPRRVATPDAR